MKHERISPDSAWPLRAADGRTWAERRVPESVKDLARERPAFPVHRHYGE